MALVASNIGDFPQRPGAWAETYIPDQLIAGALQLVSQPILIAVGAAYSRGTILGRISDYGVTSAAGAANTGNGTIGSIATAAGVLEGDYVLTATSDTAFDVTDPEGNALSAATVGTAYSDSGLSFTLTAGGTAFVAGDTFTVTVVDAIGKFIPCVKTASDGSQVPVAVLADYTDASTADASAGGYFMGEFNANAIIYDDSWTPAQLAAAMPNGLFLKGAVIAADPGTATPVTP